MTGRTGTVAGLCRGVLLAPALLAGCALVDQTTFNPQAGKPPVIPPAPAAAVARPAPPGPPALLTLNMEQAGDLRAAVAKPVAAARARKPGVVFDVVEVTAPDAPPAPGQFRDAAAVARAIAAEGVPAGRIHLAARPEAGAPPREVRVYVR